MTVGPITAVEPLATHSHGEDANPALLPTRTDSSDELLLIEPSILMTLFKTNRALTQKTASAAPPRAAEYTIWSESLNGFGLRIRPSGKASYILVYRPKGRRKQRRYTIGSREALTLKQALDIGRRTLAEVLAGRDPSEEKKLSRTATVRMAFDEYCQKLLPRRSSAYASSIRRAFRARLLPRIGDKALVEIKRADIRRITDEILSEGSDVHAINVHRMASAFLTWCAQEDLIAFNPLHRTRLPADREFRDHVIGLPGLIEIWRRCESLTPHWRIAIRLLILTGLRKSEVLNASWREIDFERGLWIIPRERTKNRTVHSIPLTPKIAEELRGAPRSGDFVFASPIKPLASVSGVSYAVQKLRGMVRGKGWRLHDIRRSVATHMAALKVQPHIIEKILNHRSGQISGVAAIYNRHGYDDEKRDALQKWHQHLFSEMDKLADEVAPIRLELSSPHDDIVEL